MLPHNRVAEHYSVACLPGGRCASVLGPTRQAVISGTCLVGGVCLLRVPHALAPKASTAHCSCPPPPSLPHTRTHTCMLHAACCAVAPCVPMQIARQQRPSVCTCQQWLPQQRRPSWHGSACTLSLVSVARVVRCMPTHTTSCVSWCSLLPRQAHTLFSCTFVSLLVHAAVHSVRQAVIGLSVE